jgi:hypothetical protein
LQLEREFNRPLLPGVECGLVAHRRCAMAILPPKPPAAQRRGGLAPTPDYWGLMRQPANRPLIA